MDREDDFLHKLDLIFAYIKELLKIQQQGFSRQEELFALLQSANHNQLNREAEDVWLTKAAVIDELCIAPRTFYRRKKEGNWTLKESGGQVYYLKSSLRS